MKSHWLILFYSLSLLQGCKSGVKSGSNGAVPNGEADTVGYYSMEDFGKVAKIDAHVHVRTGDPTFLLLARGDNFRLLSLSTDEAPGIQVQDDYAARQMKAFPDVLAYATAFPVSNWHSKNWPEEAIAGLQRAFARGASSVKIYKNIGMELKDAGGKLVMIDDPRFDPVLDFLAEQHIPVTGHLGEPRNCWLPVEEMTISADKRYFSRHPEFHMYRHPEFPSYEEQVGARDHMLEKHPGLKFVGAHLGSLEWSTGELAKRLDSFPNMAVDMAARISHLQLQTMKDRQMVRDFFIRYQDRLLYGTDRIADVDSDPAAFRQHAHEAWLLDWRFFCTDETMQSPSFEGEFNGLKLPREVIDKIYRLNAEKWFPALKGMK
ncbi:MAG TPA: amidohydrolase family protein [Anseongella sp.]|nr:amidohydrolase family protein [Anseongella sp.]